MTPDISTQEREAQLRKMERRDNEKIIVTIAGGMYPICQGCCVSCDDPRVEIRRIDNTPTLMQSEAEARLKFDAGTERLLCALMYGDADGKVN